MREKKDMKLWILFGAVLLSGKGLLGLEIHMCSMGSRVVTEYSNVSVKCGQCSKRINWFIGEDNDQQNMTYIGSCTETDCTVQDMFAFRLSGSRQNSYYNSVLDIITIPRGNTLLISCECYTYSSWYRRYIFDESALCRLRIEVPVSIVPNSCSVQLSQWKVVGVCTIQWLDNPVCKWSLTYRNKRTELDVLQGYLVDYPVDDINYRRENCSFEVDMPIDEENYTFSISVSSYPGDQFLKTFSVEQPEVPKHNCPETVLEGSNLYCTCFAAKMGNPPAQIKWIEQNNENLVLENVQQKNSSTNATCRLSWGRITKTISYIIRVAYGPSKIYINSSTESASEEWEKIIFVCTAADVYPSAVFRWNISCDDETHNVNTSTCTLSTARLGDEVTVECTAKNDIFENVSSYASYFLNLKRRAQIPTGNTEAHSNGVANSVQGGIIGGVVAAVAIIAVIAALVVVYIMKRRNGGSGSEKGVSGSLPGTKIVFRGTGTLTKLYAVVNKPQLDKPTKRIAAPSGDLYTTASTTSAGQDKDEYKAVWEATENKAYRTESNITLEDSDATGKTNERTKAGKLTVTPILIIPEKMMVHDLSDTGYMNVTTIPTDPGLGVYHVVPRGGNLGNLGILEPDTSVYSAAKVPEEEYNVLQFEEDRTGLEDHASHYNHLQQSIK